MSETDWNPWKMTTFGLLLVGATALVTTLVMGYRDDREDVNQTGATSRANALVRKTSVPSQIDVEACQAYASSEPETRRWTWPRMLRSAVSWAPGPALQAAPSPTGAAAPARERRDTMRNTRLPTVHACVKKGNDRPSKRGRKHGTVG